jgi:hypothetical protein
MDMCCKAWPQQVDCGRYTLACIEPNSCYLDAAALQDMAQAVCKSAASSFWNSSSSNIRKPPDVSDIPTAAEALLGCLQALNPLSAALLASQGLPLRVLIDRLVAAQPGDPLLTLGVPAHSLRLLAAQLTAVHLRLEPSPERPLTSSRRRGVHMQQQQQQQVDAQLLYQQQQQMQVQTDAELLYQQQLHQQQLLQQQRLQERQQQMPLQEQQQQHGYPDEHTWQQQQHLAYQQQQQQLLAQQQQQQMLAEQQALLADDQDDVLLSRMHQQQQHNEWQQPMEQHHGVAAAGYMPDVRMAEDDFEGSAAYNVQQQQQQQQLQHRQPHTAVRHAQLQQRGLQQQHHQQQLQGATWEEDEDMLEQQQLWAGHPQQQQQHEADLPMATGIDPSGVLDAFLSHRGTAAPAAAAGVGSKRPRHAPAPGGWGSVQRQNPGGVGGSSMRLQQQQQQQQGWAAGGGAGSAYRSRQRQQQQQLAYGALDGHWDQGVAAASAAAAGPAAGFDVMANEGDELGGVELPFTDEFEAGDVLLHQHQQGGMPGQRQQRQQQQQQQHVLGSARRHGTAQGYGYRDYGLEDGGFGGGGLLHDGSDGLDEQPGADMFAAPAAARRTSAAALFGQQQQRQQTVRQRAGGAAGAFWQPEHLTNINSSSRKGRQGAADMFGVGSSSRALRSGLGSAAADGLAMGLSPSLGYPDQEEMHNADASRHGGACAAGASADEFGFDGFGEEPTAAAKRSSAAAGSRHMQHAGGAFGCGRYASGGVGERPAAAAAGGGAFGGVTNVAAGGGGGGGAARTSCSSSLLVGAFMPHRNPTKQLKYQKPVVGLGGGGAHKQGRGKGKQQAKLFWG